MKRTPKYKFHVSEDGKIICVSSYAGRSVRGIAKCNMEQDEFNPSIGKKLAQLRCDVKITTKRHARASGMYDAAVRAYCAAKTHMKKMEQYFKDSYSQAEDAQKALADFESKI